jgi:hypothetical protein
VQRNARGLRAQQIELVRLQLWELWSTLRQTQTPKCAKSHNITNQGTRARALEKVLA